METTAVGIAGDGRAEFLRLAKGPRRILPGIVLELMVDTRPLRDYIVREWLLGSDPDDLKGDTPLITGGILDLMAILKLAVFIEDAYGVAVELKDVDQMDSLVKIARVIQRKIDSKEV